MNDAVAPAHPEPQPALLAAGWCAKSDSIRAVISLWRRGFGDGESWEVHDAPSGDFLITMRGMGEEWPDWSSWEDEFSMCGLMREITFFALPHVFRPDSRVVQLLLDLHESIYPLSRHPSADELLRMRHYDKYLDDLALDLEDAVKHRLIRVERFERPWPFPEVGEKPDERAPEKPADEEAGTVRLHLVSPEGLEIPEVAFVIHFADGSQRKGRLDREGRVTLRGTPPGAFEVEYLDLDQIRAKALAARAHAAVAQKDGPRILGVLCQSSTLLKLIAAAYREYFDGQGLVKAVKGAVADTPNEIPVEYLLSEAGIDTDSDATVVAMARPDLKDDADEMPEQEGGSVIV